MRISDSGMRYSRMTRPSPFVDPSGWRTLCWRYSIFLNSPRLPVTSSMTVPMYRSGQTIEMSIQGSRISLISCPSWRHRSTDQADPVCEGSRLDPIGHVEFPEDV